MLDQANRTFICSVVFIDLVGYSKKPVTEQIRLKTSLTTNLSEAIKDIPVNDRIILDTGDGAAISFLGDPEDALFVTLSLREKMVRENATATQVEASGEDAVRMGINLGPVKLVKDINGHPNIIGDGINVAQRIMSFARPGQIVVSRSYYDVVSNLATEYAKLFHYEGSRTDKHVREHEIYVVGHNEGALAKAKEGMADRASATAPGTRKPREGVTAGTSTVTLTIPSFVHDRRKLSIIAGGLGVIVLVLGILVATKHPSTPPLDTAAVTMPSPKTATEPAAPASAAEAPKPSAPPRAESSVLEPKPAAAQVPAAAPRAADTHDKAAPNGAKPATKAAETKTESAKAGLPPATLVFAVQPWGEIYVNGKSRGVTPPMKSLKLDPGRYKVEVRNTTFAPYVQNLDLKSRDEITVRYKFQ